MQKKYQILLELIIPSAIIFFAVILRLLPHPPNMAPITALALFGGTYINKKFAFIFPFLAMIVSDYFLGFHDTMFFVYGSFFLSGVIGLWIRRFRSPARIIGGTFAASLLFFLITNFGVWLVSSMYAHTFSGLIEAYTLAIPFYRNTVGGDFLYTGLLFSVFELMRYLFLVANLKKQNS